ncbi:MAG TPA: hypothetical protein VEL74_12125 [Thermoanaerobaculia bacterium]|nr:hypothetical protein [Thermoanaerobaculia bacterium]
MDPKRTPRPGAGPAPTLKPGPAKPGAAPGVPKRPGAGPATPQPPGRRGTTSYKEPLDRLATDIRQLQIEFERFFAGALPIPPEDLRNRVQAQLRTLRNATITAAVDSFRLGDLEARFNTYNELFNRRLREREEGRHRAPRPAPVEVQRFDPLKGVVVGADVDPEAAEALYQGLASRPASTPRFDLDAFRTYLSRQVSALQAKTGCAEVQFRLAEEEGTLKLKARPVNRQGS